TSYGNSLLWSGALSCFRIICQAICPESNKAAIVNGVVSGSSYHIQVSSRLTLSRNGLEQLEFTASAAFRVDYGLANT
ncbi:hypothetical protein DFJ58DRAFT_912840, partial [Suillus subalutaceus]|uniref:uncharacterized protein n=1 Tax=Suillus subalutaceus TaxID=48586 RepID=UPI001B885E17